MPKTTNKYNLRIIIPTILSVVFGSVLLIIICGYVLFKNTTLLDESVLIETLDKICQEENLAQTKENLLEKDPEFPNQTKEERLREYYLYEYSVCDGTEDEDSVGIFIDGYDRYLEIKGVSQSGTGE